VWVEGELLLWFLRGDTLPPLATTSPVGTPRAAAGVLGLPGTAVLFGNQTVNDDLRVGFRLRSGAWLDCDNLCGVEGSFFFVGSQSTGFLGTAPILTRPFFNALTNAQDAEIVSFPGVASGTIRIEDRRGDFYGTDANARCNLCCGCNYRVDLLGGYRYLRLTDGLSIQEQLTSTNPASLVPVGTGIAVQDSFRTRNTFNGGQIGLAGEYRWSNLIVGLRGLAAVGDLHRTVDIDGSTVVAVPGQAPVTNAGGLLALPSNSGHFTSDRVAFASEVGITLGYQLTSHVRLSAGYSFLLLTNAVRTGDQIDLVVNPSQLPPGTLAGPARPAFMPHATDFWAQGVTLGLELRY
jgi:hypothetical protein